MRKALAFRVVDEIMGTESSEVEYESNKANAMAGYATRARRLPMVRKGPRRVGDGPPM